MLGNFFSKRALFNKNVFACGAMFATLPVMAPAIADDASERAILVLDASGSMWGQVDGTPKTTIARDVIQGCWTIGTRASTLA